MVGSRDALPVTKNNVSPRATAQKSRRSGRLGEIQLADLNSRNIVSELGQRVFIGLRG
jgi:hypothetical protein